MKPRKRHGNWIPTTAHGNRIDEAANTRNYKKISSAMLRGISRLHNVDPNRFLRRGGMSVKDWKRKQMNIRKWEQKIETAAVVDEMIASRPLKPPGKR